MTCQEPLLHKGPLERKATSEYSRYHQLKPLQPRRNKAAAVRNQSTENHKTVKRQNTTASIRTTLSYARGAGTIRAMITTSRSNTHLILLTFHRTGVPMTLLCLSLHANNSLRKGAWLRNVDSRRQRNSIIEGCCFLKKRKNKARWN